MPTTVHITDQGDQIISGVKTFDVFPIVSGNKLITGVDLSSYLTSSTASSTYSTITNLASTGSTLVGSITSLSGLFTGYTGALDATFASDTQLYTTGSTLDSKINSLSGNLTSTYATITNLATTGSTLDTKINNLSGYINNSSSNIVYSTGDQTISGTKTFANSAIISEILTSGESIYISSGEIFRLPSYNPFTNKDFDINLLNYPYSNSYISMGHETGRVGPSINSANSFRELKIWETGGYITSWIYKMARFGPYGVILSEDNFSKVGIGTTFPTEKVHISGGNLKVEGNAIANNLVYNTGDQIISGFKTFATGIFAPNLVYNTGNQTISGNKNFYGDVVLSGNSNRIGQYHYIDVNSDFVRIKYENGINALDTEENNLRSTDGVESLSWQGRSLTDSTNIVSIHWEEKYLANNLGVPLLTWTGDNIGIGTNIPTEKLQVDGNIRINDGGGLYIYDQPEASDNKITWQDSELLFQLDFNNVNNSFRQAGFLFDNGPLGETALYSYRVGDASSTSLYIPSGRQGYIAVDSDLVATGSNLNNKINNVSGYINSSSSNIVFTTGNQIISGVKTIEDLKTQNLSLNDLVGGNSGITFKLNDGDLQVSNKSGVMLGLSNLSASPFTGLNNIVLTSDNTTIKLPPNKNDFIAMSSEVVYNTGNQTISGVKTFNNGLSTSRISGIFGSTLNIIAGSGVGASSINASDLILIGGSLSGVSPNILKTGASITLGGAKTVSTADITIRPSVDQNASAGNIILEAGLSTTYNGKINMFGDINVNGTSDLGTALSSKNINIYRRGDFFGSPSQRLAISIDNNNANFQNGMGLQVSGVQVTPALYVDRINNQIINGLKTFTSGIDIYSGTSPQSLRIFNSTGTNSGEFALIGWRNNQFVIGSQQSQSGILRDVVITGNNININGSGALNIFDNTNIVGNLTISGNTTITGHLSAASKSFLIDHPTQIGKKLQYGSLEGPEHGVFVRGKTNENIINLPNYWPALVDENSISVNLTSISAANNIYVVDYNNSRITTNGNNGNYYFYTVYGERKDIPKLTVEF